MLEAVALIGLGIAAWKVSNSVMGAINWFKENSKQGKLALGITMAITGFTLASSGWIEIGKGDASIQDALKAAIGTALGVAGTALALGGGPAGWTVGILAGLAVSVISLTVGYERSLKTLVMETFLNADGAISISDVVVRFDNLMVEITGGMDSVIMASQNIQSLKDNVSGANNEIFKIASAWANGVISTEKAVPQLIEIIGGLKTDTKTILDEIYNNIVEAIGGSFGNALIEAGYSTDEVLQLLKEIRGESEVSIDSLVTSLEELETQLQSGEITANEFGTKYAEIQTQLEKLIGKTDLTSGAFDGLYGSLEKIDWSSIKDSGEITSFIEEIATSTETAKNKIDEYYGGIISGLETLRENVEDPEMQVEIDRWIKVAEGARDEDKRQIDENLQELVDYIQWDVTQKIPVIAENAGNEWETFSPVKKFFIKEDKHVYSALKRFQDDVIDPINKEIDKQLGITGDEQSANASEALAAVLTGMYDISGSPANYIGLQAQFKTTISNDMSNLLDAYGIDATARAKITGGAIIEGQYEGAKSKLEILKEAWSKLFKTIGAIFDREYKIESPSKVFKEKGGHLVQGLWDGMTEIWNKLKSWWSNLSLPELKFKMPRFSWNSDNGIKATGALKTVLEFLNLPTSIPKLQVSWYAAGGFPDMGELFVAREAGPELVGRIGGRTAVVSNQDIVAAVSQGVESAVRRAYSGGAGANSNPVVYVYVGDEQVAAHVEKANRFNTMRTNGR